MESTRIVVIGGSDTGIAAGLAARSTNPQCAVEVLLQDDFPNYSVCGLPFLLSGEVADWRALAHRQQSELESQRVVVLRGHRAVDVDPARRQVVVESSAGRSVHPYDLPGDRNRR